MARTAQTYANHRRLLPPVHFFVIPVLLINVGVEIARLNKYRTPYHVWMVVVTLALLVLGFTARSMALAAQDRTIRLEERLRLAALLPADQRARINDLTPHQLIGIRFASDEEVPALVQRCLAGELRSTDDVKKVVKSWRPDYLRV
ncbi:MAG: DUF6526 family protein [Gemmatimonadaceae bacterium]|nr:DUF6526 family protein [Gemmatimonadaceae bacterium]